MKFSVVVLVIAGIAAALAACLAVSALSTQHWGASISPASKSPDTTVLVAKDALPAMTVVDDKSIETKSMPRDKAPANALTDPVQAVGKVLIAPLDQGQALTTTDFATDGSRLQLASKLAPGMRAVSVNVSDAGALAGLLFPGSSVDVLVALKRSEADNIPDTISTTLLENIPVIGVEDETIVNNPSEKKDEAQGPSQPHVRKVTLMVDMQQAKALQLAQDSGVISLAMRRPGDKTRNVGAAPVTLSEIAGMPTPVNDTPPVRTVATATAASHSVAPQADDSQWQTTIIRGNAIETRAFALPAGQEGSQPRN